MPASLRWLHAEVTSDMRHSALEVPTCQPVMNPVNLVNLVTNRLDGDCSGVNHVANHANKVTYHVMRHVTGVENHVNRTNGVTNRVNCISNHVNPVPNPVAHVTTASTMATV